MLKPTSFQIGIPVKQQQLWVHFFRKSVADSNGNTIFASLLITNSSSRLAMLLASVWVGSTTSAAFIYGSPWNFHPAWVSRKAAKITAQSTVTTKCVLPGAIVHQLLSLDVKNLGGCSREARWKTKLKQAINMLENSNLCWEARAMLLSANKALERSAGRVNKTLNYGPGVEERTGSETKKKTAASRPGKPTYIQIRWAGSQLEKGWDCQARSVSSNQMKP